MVELLETEFDINAITSSLHCSVTWSHHSLWQSVQPGQLGGGWLPRAPRSCLLRLMPWAWACPGPLLWKQLLLQLHHYSDSPRGKSRPESVSPANCLAKLCGWARGYSLGITDRRCLLMRMGPSLLSHRLYSNNLSRCSLGCHDAPLHRVPWGLHTWWPWIMDDPPRHLSLCSCTSPGISWRNRISYNFIQI